MWDELLTTFRAIARSADDRVVVITGAGGAFCWRRRRDLAAGDGGGRAAAPARLMRHVGDICLALHRLPQPTIAKVRGVPSAPA